MNPLRTTLLVAALLLAAGPLAAEDAATTPPAPPATPPSTTAPAATAPAANAPAATAPAAPIEPTNTVVATVNGEPVTQLDLAAAEPDLQQALSQFPQDAQFGALVKGVIDIRLMARAAAAEGLDKDANTARQLAYAHDKTLRNAYLQKKLSDQITDATLKARYDAEVAKFVPKDEIHAVHILVNSEDEAKAIIAQLDQGGDFAAIAKAKSTDAGSGAAGGDLGWFGEGQMVKAFSDAAFALAVGQYTKTPVKSDFGFHVIKVLEKRKSAPPTFEQRKEGLARDFAREIILAEIDKLHAAAKIEIVPPPGQAPAPADGAPAPAAPAPAATAPATAAPAAPGDGAAAPAPAQ